MLNDIEVISIVPAQTVKPKSVIGIRITDAGCHKRKATVDKLKPDVFESFKRYCFATVCLD